MNTVGPQRFADRSAAGSILGELLAAQGLGSDAVVLGLLRGGVPDRRADRRTAWRLSVALAVRKLGIPDQPEVAFGAVASHRQQHVAHQVPRIHEYALRRHSPAMLEAVERRAGAKLLRLSAALRVVSLQGPAGLVVAVPGSPAKVLRELSDSADDVICHRSPPDFSSAGIYFEDFSQVSELEILRLCADFGTKQ